MTTTAIICEYNPFHNGHKYQIDKAKAITNCDAVLCLQSGNFVQRGDFAVYPKEVRAKAAILNGADLILENPTHFVLQSAEGYASSAVYILSALGCVDFLAFGAETDDLPLLKNIAEFLCDEPVSYKTALTENLKLGMSYPSARGAALNKCLGKSAKDVISKPNNLLAVEYLKALFKLNSKITPILIPRTGVEHHSNEANGVFASASQIRDILKNDSDLNVWDFVPSSTAELYKDLSSFYDSFSDKAIHTALCLMSTEQILRCSDITEGLENKIKKQALSQKNLKDTIEAVKSKRYPLSRIRRAVLCAYLGTDKVIIKSNPPYAKILDFNQNGQALLNKCKKTAEITVAKNASAIKKDKYAMDLWKKELEFDKVYEILSHSVDTI